MVDQVLIDLLKGKISAVGDTRGERRGRQIKKAFAV
jgi:hypothetical protein